MRRAALTVTATVAGLVLLLSYRSHGGASLLRPGAFASAAPRAGGASPAPVRPQRTAGSTPRPRATTPGASRTVTGQTADTPYGPVQIALVVAGSTITDVRPLQLPQGTGRDIEIDNYAVPQLIQETLAAQSAQIDSVSGATYTSEGYLASLQSALDQVHA